MTHLFFSHKLLNRFSISKAIEQIHQTGCPTHVLAAPTVVSKPIIVRHPIRTLAELQQQIHNDLRTQHPEWVEPNGESPMCDFYEARLIQLLETYARSGSDESIAAVHRTLEQAAAPAA